MDERSDQAALVELGRQAEALGLVRTLPTSFEEDDVLYVLASPRDHLEEYVLEEHTRGLSLMGEDREQLLKEIRPGQKSLLYRPYAPLGH